jgi:hypothetical protein
VARRNLRFTRDGGLLSYGPDRIDIFRRAATYVDRILRGAKPGELPVQAPIKFEMAVNLKTVKALGLAVPASILLRADEVIEQRSKAPPRWGQNCPHNQMASNAAMHTPLPVMEWSGPREDERRWRNGLPGACENL